MNLHIERGKSKTKASGASKSKFPVRLSKLVTTSVKNLMVRRRSRQRVNPLLVLSFVLVASVVWRSEWLRKVELQGLARQVLHSTGENQETQMKIQERIERSLDGDRWKREELKLIPNQRNLPVANRQVIESRASDKFTIVRKGVTEKTFQGGVGNVGNSDDGRKGGVSEERGRLKRRWKREQGRRREFRRAMRRRMESKGSNDSAADGGKNRREIDVEKGRTGNKGSSYSDSSNTRSAFSNKRVSRGLLIPAGARTHGRLDFHGSLGGTENGMIRGQNITRISYTLFKIMKLFGFRSLTDHPCGAHHEWMGEVVSWLAYENPAFEYVGSDDDSKGVSLAKQAVGRFVDGEFQSGHALDNKSDVVFYWNELDGSERDARDKRYGLHMREVIRRAKNGGNAYIVFGQYPRLNGPQVEYRNGKWRLSGEREEPFLYNDYVRGVIAVEGTGIGYVLYMTFYCLRSIPKHVLDV